MTGKSPAIGIDLGTTYSCVAVYQNGRVEVIANDKGNRTTASYVNFTESEILIGDAAKDQAARNPKNTIYNVKRLIGRKFSDVSIQEDMKHLLFNVVDSNDKPMIQVDYQGKERQFYPEGISSMVLKQIKQSMEDYLGQQVQDAVVTVPAYFNDSQRRATMDACIMAGLNVLRIINEPTAVALAYGLDKGLQGEKNVMICDLGGGYFDVSIVTINEGSVFEVKATAGDNYLGGEDFDNKMVNYFIREFNMLNKVSLSGLRPMRRLKTACERAKRILSSTLQASLEIDSLFEGIDFETRIGRAKFEEICSDLFKRILIPLEKVLVDAKMEKSQIDDIVLIGGATRIPKIQQVIKEFMGGKEMNNSINRDEAVAYGAAVEAAVLTGAVKDIRLVDILPRSIGMKSVGGMMTNFFRRTSQIPNKTSRTFTTFENNQTVITIELYEGEMGMVKDNNHIGDFQLHHTGSAPRGVPRIEVTFCIDLNGLLSVTAVDLNTDIQLKVIDKRGCISKELFLSTDDSEEPQHKRTKLE